MSIIHDALKKAQSEEKLSGGRNSASENGPASKKTGSNTLVMVLAIVIGVTALGAIAWRFGPLLMVRQRAGKTDVSGRAASAVIPSARVSAPGMKSGKEEVSMVDRRVRDAERLLRIGDLAAAESLFRAILASGEGNRAEVINNLGLTLKRRGRFKEALGYYSQALEADQEMPEVLNNRAVLFRKLKRYSDAESDLRTALKIRPEYSEALFNLAVVYEASGKKLAALDAYRKYLDNSSREPGLVDPRVRQRISFVEAELAATEWKSRRR